MKLTLNFNIHQPLVLIDGGALSEFARHLLGRGLGQQLDNDAADRLDAALEDLSRCNRADDLNGLTAAFAPLAPAWTAAAMAAKGMEGEERDATLIEWLSRMLATEVDQEAMQLIEAAAERITEAGG